LERPIAAPDSLAEIGPAHQATSAPGGPTRTARAWDHRLAQVAQVRDQDEEREGLLAGDGVPGHRAPPISRCVRLEVCLDSREVVCWTEPVRCVCVAPLKGVARHTSRLPAACV